MFCLEIRKIVFELSTIPSFIRSSDCSISVPFHRYSISREQQSFDICARVVWLSQKHTIQECFFPNGHLKSWVFYISGYNYGQPGIVQCHLQHVYEFMIFFFKFVNFSPNKTIETMAPLNLYKNHTAAACLHTEAVQMGNTGRTQAL